MKVNLYSILKNDSMFDTFMYLLHQKYSVDEAVIFMKDITE